MSTPETGVDPLIELIRETKRQAQQQAWQEGYVTAYNQFFNLFSLADLDANPYSYPESE